MATTPISESLTVTTQERTWRVTIDTPLSADYTLTAHRETVRTANDTVLSKVDTGTPITRSLSQALADEVTLDSGKTLTVEELAEALVLFIEQWHEEDQVSAAPEEDPDPEA